ncbi:MAG: universal stress protein [Solirubrobacterales bacterium]
MGSIVVGIDGSSCAFAAVDEAAKLAKELNDRVTVVFGYEPARIGGEIQDHRAALEELGEDLGKQALDRVAAAGADGELKLVDTEAVEALVGVADQLDARMIVVGSYGDSPLKGAILGSIPHKLVHISKRPLLVVHGADD